MEAEIISWPSLWRADCAACFVARCRIPRPVRKLCGAGPRACTGGRHSGPERPESRGFSDFPLLILIYVSLVQPRTHSPGGNHWGFHSVQNSIILFSASLSRQSCASPSEWDCRPTRLAARFRWFRLVGFRLTDQCYNVREEEDFCSAAGQGGQAPWDRSEKRLALP